MTLKQETIEALAETLQERQAFYNMLAAFYCAPLTAEQVEKFAVLDYPSLAVGQELIDMGFDDMRRYMRKRNTGTRQALASDYTGTFAGIKTYKEKVGTPCASLFAEGNQRFFGEEWKNIKRIYAHEGEKVQSDMNLPEDHLTYMLQFLGILSMDCLEALQKGDVKEAKRKLEVSKSFIEEQILSWFDKFMDTTSYLIETRFYRGVIRITKGYLELDDTTIDELLLELDAIEKEEL